MLSRAMTVTEVKENKKQYIGLLLLADEQEDMIDRYLDCGVMYVLDDNGVKCECVLTDEGNGILEIKNIATLPEFQKRGYASALIDHIAKKYSDRFSVLQVGTGDSPVTVPFYEKCGFVRSHVLPNFFVDNYDHPIYEGGVRLVDMVYLRRRLRKYTDKKLNDSIQERGFDKQELYELLCKIPQGKVVTYGTLACLLGNKKWARAVGRALHSNTDGCRYPCYKVVNSKGELSHAYAFGGIDEQKCRLEKEGIKVENGKVDMRRYECTADELSPKLAVMKCEIPNKNNEQE